MRKWPRPTADWKYRRKSSRALLITVKAKDHQEVAGGTVTAEAGRARAKTKQQREYGLEEVKTEK
jgi:hypothetical protein